MSYALLQNHPSDSHVHPTGEDTRVEYQPYKQRPSGNLLRLRLIDRGLSRDLLRYCFILRIRHTAPSLLSVIYADCVFTLVGQYLEELERLLDDERVSEIHVYNPLHHRPPPPGTPIIEKIRMEPRREAGERPMH